MRGFEFICPPWVIVNLDFVETVGMPNAIVPLELPDSPAAFAIFSDEDLAERALRGFYLSPEKCKAMQLDSFEQLLWYAQQLQFIGCVNVIVDYTGRPGEWKLSSDISALIEYCERQIEG